jgi:hypothetical protein
LVCSIGWVQTWKQAFGETSLRVTSFLLGYEGPQSVPSDIIMTFVKLFHLVCVAETTFSETFFAE